MSALHDQQVKFARLLPRLLDKAFELGYEVTGGEWQRTQAQAQANAATGAGISHSVHLVSLAVDLHLFKDSVYLIDSADYEPLGSFWKTLDPDCRWGGDFHTRPDGNHFSLTWEGVS